MVQLLTTFFIKIFNDIAKYKIKNIALALAPCGDPIFVINSFLNSLFSLAISFTSFRRR